MVTGAANRCCCNTGKWLEFALADNSEVANEVEALHVDFSKYFKLSFSGQCQTQK